MCNIHNNDNYSKYFIFYPVSMLYVTRKVGGGHFSDLRDV